MKAAASRAPTHHPHPVSLAELARRAGVNRSSITRLFRGRLRPALVGDRADAAHPLVVAWAIERGIDHRALLDRTAGAHPFMLDEVAPSLARLAEIRGVSPAVAKREAATWPKDAMVPPGHLAIRDFAKRAGASVTEVLEAIHTRELAPALVAGGRLDIGHPASLAFVGRHPFERDAKDEIISPDADGYLGAAFVGDDDIDVDHPIARAFLARCLGRVPTEEDLVLPEEGSS